MAAALGDNHAGLALRVRVDFTIVSFGRPRGVTPTVVCFVMMVRAGATTNAATGRGEAVLRIHNYPHRTVVAAHDFLRDICVF